MKRIKTTEDFIKKAIISDKHKNCIYNKTIWTGITNKVIITCLFHGDFEQLPGNHIYKDQGCFKCGVILSIKKQSSTKEKFLEKIQTNKKIIKEKYTFNDFDYKNNKTKSWITCLEHGNFLVSPSNFLKGHGCPICGNCPKPELKINKILTFNNIKFETQKKFKDCKNKQLLPFDFYLSKYNLCIEHDGIQHFIAKAFCKDPTGEIKKQNLLSTQTNDQIKNQFCLDNNIKLIRINYKQNIEEELTKLFIDLLKL